MDSLSEAFRLYTGWGTSPFPRSDRDAVLDGLGPEMGRVVLAQLDALLAEAGDLRPDWTQHTLATATDWAQGQIKARNPDLPPEVMRLLGWTFSYWWK